MSSPFVSPILFHKKFKLSYLSQNTHWDKQPYSKRKVAFTLIRHLAHKVTKKTDKLAMRSSGFLEFLFLVGVCNGEEQGEF